MEAKDRRNFERIRPTQPIRASIGTARIYVLDGSAGGVGVLHENTLPEPGDICRIEITSEFGPITLDCEVVRTVPHTSGRTRVPRPLFESGLRVIAADHQSVQRLRSTFSDSATKPHHDN